MARPRKQANFKILMGLNLAFKSISAAAGVITTEVLRNYPKSSNMSKALRKMNNAISDFNLALAEETSMAKEDGRYIEYLESIPEED